MGTLLGADYSFARPGGAALAASGVTAVGRYLADDERGITAAEYADLRAHNIGVWVCREGRASGMLGGFNQGSADAQIAVRQLAAAGLPADMVVYATADFDVQDSQFAVCDDYMRGFASVLGVARVGLYGGLHYLNHVHAAGLASRFWQAGATSWDHGEAPTMPIDFHQTTITPPLPGTDHNYVNDIRTTTLGTNANTQEDDVPNIYEIVAGRTDPSGTHYLSVNRIQRYPLSKQSEQDYQYFMKNTLKYTDAQCAVQVVNTLDSFGPVIQSPVVNIDTDALAAKIAAQVGGAASPEAISEAVTAAVVEEIKALAFRAS